MTTAEQSREKSLTEARWELAQADMDDLRSWRQCLHREQVMVFLSFIATSLAWLAKIVPEAFDDTNWSYSTLAMLHLPALVGLVAVAVASSLTLGQVRRSAYLRVLHEAMLRGEVPPGYTGWMSVISLGVGTKDRDPPLDSMPSGGQDACRPTLSQIWQSYFARIAYYFYAGIAAASVGVCAMYLPRVFPTYSFGAPFAYILVMAVVSNVVHHSGPRWFNCWRRSQDWKALYESQLYPNVGGSGR